MLKVKSKMLVIVSVFIMCVMLMFTFFVPTVSASAATSSSGTRTQTITVITKANWWLPGSESITLQQTQGVCKKTTTNWLTGKKSTKTSKEYGTWHIIAKATDGSHTVKKTLSGKSVKINLKPNKTYAISVDWSEMIAMGIEVSKGNFTLLPTWRVSSTWKVDRYY